MKALSLIITLVAGSIPIQAAAMPFCADRHNLAENLAQRFDEAHKASGLRSATELVEIWVSDASGTWTILLTTADGNTCILASGPHWLAFPEPVEAEGNPA